MKTFLQSLVAMFIMLLAPKSFATFNYEGVLTLPDGSPVTSMVSLTLQIKGSGSDCLLYEESIAGVVPDSDGAFNVQMMGPSAVRSGADPGLTAAQVFTNGVLITGAAGCSYTGAVGAGRQMYLTVHQSGLVESFGPMALNAVPRALVADSIAGLTPTSILRVNSGTQLTQSNLESIFSNYSELSTLVAGTSSLYAKTSPGAGTQLTMAGGTPGSVGNGQIWLNTTSNSIQFTDNTGAVQTLGVGGAGLSSLNGLTSSAQTFQAGTSGTAPSWSSSSAVHTLNIPMASATGVTAGLISKADHDSFSARMTSVLNNGQVWIGNGSNVATPQVVTGDLTLMDSGVATVVGLRDVGLSATTPAVGNVLQYDGSVWTPGEIFLSHLKSTIGGTSLFPGACGAGQVLNYSSPTDQYLCQPFVITRFDVQGLEISSPTTFYVRSGGNNTCNGLSAALGTPPSSCAKASLNVMLAELPRMISSQVTVDVGSGTFTAGTPIVIDQIFSMGAQLRIVGAGYANTFIDASSLATSPAIIVKGHTIYQGRPGIVFEALSVDGHPSQAAFRVVGGTLQVKDVNINPAGRLISMDGGMAQLLGTNQLWVTGGADSKTVIEVNRGTLEFGDGSTAGATTFLLQTGDTGSMTGLSVFGGDVRVRSNHNLTIQLPTTTSSGMNSGIRLGSGAHLEVESTISINMNNQANNRGLEVRGAEVYLHPGSNVSGTNNAALGGFQVSHGGVINTSYTSSLSIDGNAGTHLLVEHGGQVHAHGAMSVNTSGSLQALVEVRAGSVFDFSPQGASPSLTMARPSGAWPTFVIKDGSRVEIGSQSFAAEYQIGGTGADPFAAVKGGSVLTFSGSQTGSNFADTLRVMVDRSSRFEGAISGGSHGPGPEDIEPLCNAGFQAVGPSGSKICVAPSTTSGQTYNNAVTGSSCSNPGTRLCRLDELRKRCMTVATSPPVWASEMASTTTAYRLSCASNVPTVDTYAVGSPADVLCCQE